MPKCKTHRGLNKRIKITASGKVKHRRAGAGHLLSKKTADKRRLLSRSIIMSPGMAEKAKKLLYG